MAQSFQIDNLYLIKRQTRQNSFPQILKSKEQEFVEDVDEEVMVRDSAGEAWEEVKKIIRAEEAAKRLGRALPESSKNLGKVPAVVEPKVAEEVKPAEGDWAWGAHETWGPGPWEKGADEKWGTGPWEEEADDGGHGPMMEEEAEEAEEFYTEDYSPMMEDMATQTDPAITQLDNPLVSAVRIFVCL